MLKKIIVASWFSVISLLFLYSFTQVDLGLTLNRSSFITDFQKSFQYVGYFNRPLSAFLSSVLFIALFTVYVFTLKLVWKKKLQAKTVWVITILTGIILLFSYNAYSHDLFNYMFDAKIVTKYGQNPYVKKALDFTGDPYLGFMHWTHRTYPYGPVWLGLTIPLSFIGSQIFILTFYFFKLLMVGAYFACSYLIYKIANQRKGVNPVFALAFFSLNPLVIVEGLVSSHHDLVMIAISLFAVYLLFSGKNFFSWVTLILSIGVKFATFLLSPLFLWYPFSKRRNKEELFLLASTIIMIIAVVIASYRTTFQPWYLLFVIPFASLVSNKYFVLVPTVCISFLLLFQYIPYLYTGNFDSPIPQIMQEMLVSSIAAGIIITVGYKALRHARKK